MKSIVKVLLIAAASLFGTASASVLSIVVPDASFESPDVPDARASVGIPGWNFTTNAIPGQVYGGGVHDQTTGSYPGAFGNNSPLPGTANGGQDAFIDITPNVSPAFGQFTVAGLATVAAGTQYQLTVAVGNRLDASPADITLALTVNGVAASSLLIPAGTVPNGTFTDYSVTFITLAAGDPNIGADLGISLRMDSPAAPGAQSQEADFDNIRLSATTLPEPSFTLFLLAGPAIFARRRAAKGV